VFGRLFEQSCERSLECSGVMKPFARIGIERAFHDGHEIVRQVGTQCVEIGLPFDRIPPGNEVKEEHRDRADVVGLCSR